MTNMDENGIRYGYIACNDLDNDLVHDLLYVHGKDLSYEAAVEEEIARQRSVWEDECEAKAVQAQEEGTDLVLDDFEPYLEDFDPMIDEPIIEGEYQGVHYHVSWLGGAQNLFISKSPVIGYFRLCSPCVPGAGNLSQRAGHDDGYMAYDVPPDWRFRDPDDLTFEQRMESRE